MPLKACQKDSVVVTRTCFRDNDTYFLTLKYVNETNRLPQRPYTDHSDYNGLFQIKLVRFQGLAEWRQIFRNRYASFFLVSSPH